jgi:hypothetical protein
MIMIKPGKREYDLAENVVGLCLNSDKGFSFITKPVCVHLIFISSACYFPFVMVSVVTYIN